jgi:SAM-dependent methyltransferase
MNATPLLDLYQQTSKHSNYQVLASALAPLLDSDAISVKSRHEHERLAYILARVPMDGLLVADIGGNTGFFSFELLARGARRVDYYEGNAAHHAFVQAAASRLGLAGRLQAHHRYVSFKPGELPLVDCTVLLNVLHHLGDDFGDPGTARQAAMQRMLDCLAVMARTTRVLVFQLGFNWKGDRHQPLFAGGSKQEMIDFIEQGTAADWEMAAIGIAEADGGRIVFRDCGDRNIARDDALGEFLNRPIFIMRSRHVAALQEGTSP